VEALEGKLFGVADWRIAVTRVLPRGDMAEVLVIA